MEEYLVPTAFGQAEFVEKKSRFIGHIWPAESEAEALAHIEEMRKLHYDATHNVWAYLIKDGPVRFSDDGEPGGTAGMPTLQVLQREHLFNVTCVVTRYFGGILLGGGGLIRAYSHTASIALEAARKVRMKECLLGEIACGYDQYGRVQALVPECGGVTEDTAFLEQVTVKFRLEPEGLDRLKRRLADATAGRAEFREVGKGFYPFEIEE